MNKIIKRSLILSALLLIFFIITIVVHYEHKQYNKVVIVESSISIPENKITFEITGVQNQNVIKTSHVFNGAWIDDPETFNQTILTTSTGQNFNFGKPITNAIYGYDEKFFDGEKSFDNPQSLLHKQFTYVQKPQYFLTTYIDQGKKYTINTNQYFKKQQMKYGYLQEKEADVFENNDMFQQEKDILMNQP